MDLSKKYMPHKSSNYNTKSNEKTAHKKTKKNTNIVKFVFNCSNLGIFSHWIGLSID